MSLRASPSSSAAHAVISTPELLILIISNLPPPTILVSVQLVSKSWKDILQTPAIQRLLFFNDSSAPSKLSISNPMLSDLLVSSFPPWFVNLQTRRDPTTWSASMFNSLPWSRNPDVWNRKGATWRAMLVMQPNCRFLKIERVRHSKGGRRKEADTIHCLDGLKMGILYDITEQWCEDPNTTFTVTYDMDSEAQTASNLTAWDSRGQQAVHEVLKWKDEQIQPLDTSPPEKGFVLLTLHETITCKRTSGPKPRLLGDQWRSKEKAGSVLDYLRSRS